MSAQRKLADPAHAVPRDDAAPVDRTQQSDYRSPRTADGELPTSPAILLQEQLAARVAGVGPVNDSGAVHEVRKWPMPLRIATIVGLSVALWGVVVVTAVKIIT